MSVNKEEISAHLNLDTSVLGKAKRDIDHFVKEGHSGFVHIGNGARAFHRTIHELAGQVPVLGTVIQAAFSGVGGIFVAATAAAGFFLDKLEEINKEMDARQLENMKATGTDPFVRQLELAKKLNEAIADQKEFLKRDAEAHDDVLKKMQQELNTAKAREQVDRKSVVTKEQGLALDVKSAQTQLDIISKTRQGLGQRALAAGQAANKAASAFIEAPEQGMLPKATEEMTESKKRLDKSIVERDALRIASSKVTPEDMENFRLLPSWQEVKDQASGMMGQPGLEAKLDKAEEEVRKNTEAYHKNARQVDDFGEKLEDLKKKMDDARNSFHTLDTAFGATTGDLIGMQKQLLQAQIAMKQQHSLQGFMPSEAEFAKAPGLLGNMARRVEELRQGVTSRLSVGDVRGAEALRRQLQGYDVAPAAMEPNWKNGGRLEWPAPTHVKGMEELFGDRVSGMFKGAPQFQSMVGTDVKSTSNENQIHQAVTNIASAIRGGAMQVIGADGGSGSPSANRP